MEALVREHLLASEIAVLDSDKATCARERQRTHGALGSLNDLATALENGAEKGKHAPPLSLAYKYAVEARDTGDAQQQALGLGGGVRTSQ